VISKEQEVDRLAGRKVDSRIYSSCVGLEYLVRIFGTNT